jgi:hypothetical protein
MPTNDKETIAERARKETAKEIEEVFKLSCACAMPPPGIEYDNNTFMRALRAHSKTVCDYCQDIIAGESK